MGNSFEVLGGKENESPTSENKAEKQNNPETTTKLIRNHLHS
jgi:hypothetical protein